MVASKNDQVKKIKQSLVLKRQVDQVQDYNKVVADEDPIVSDLIRSKEVAASVLVGDPIHLDKESSGISVGIIHVQSIQVDTPIEQPEQQRENQHCALYPDMRIVGPGGNVVTDLDYSQDPQCGESSFNVTASEVVLNPNVAHDLEILQQHWKGKDDMGPRVYTDEEERGSHQLFEKPFCYDGRALY